MLSWRQAVFGLELVACDVRQVRLNKTKQQMTSSDGEEDILYVYSQHILLAKGDKVSVSMSALGLILLDIILKSTLEFKTRNISILSVEKINL